VSNDLIRDEKAVAPPLPDSRVYCTALNSAGTFASGSCVVLIEPHLDTKTAQRLRDAAGCHRIFASIRDKDGFARFAHSGFADFRISSKRGSSFSRDHSGSMRNS
jgi:hypothetical protein